MSAPFVPTLSRQLSRQTILRPLSQSSKPTRSSSFLAHRVQTRWGPYICQRCLSTYPPLLAQPRSRPPQSHDRGPPSKEDTQTDFGALNVLGNTPPPATAVEVCLSDGFVLNEGLKVSGSGVLLVGGEAFRWRPWRRTNGPEQIEKHGLTGKLLNLRGQWEVDRLAWGVLDMVWPKPDLLIIGTGPSIAMLSPSTRKHINDLGIRIEVQDTRNAAAQFNLLATERGVEQVAAALIPIGWKEGR